MMQAMRNSAKIVFFLVLIAFAGFMILQGLTSIFSKPSEKNKTAPPGVIGEVDGTQIPVTYFENAYRPRMKQLLQEKEEPTEEEMQQIRDEIWNNLTSVTLLENDARKHGIVVSDAEVAEYMRISPPQDFRGMQDFQTDGKFDVQKYQEWLRQAAISNDPQVLSFLSNFENQIRQQLTITRLQELVLSMARLTPDEVKTDYIEKNEKVKVKYFFIPGADYTDSLTDASDKDLRAQFEIDKEKYKIPAKASVSYVVFEKTPSDADFDAAKVRIDSVRNAIIAGADFAKAAREISDDKGSGSAGGDLGWFSEGMMVQPFWDATIKLTKIGEISPPVKTSFGWHIIKLTGKRETPPDSLGNTKPEYKASHILLRVEASPQTITALNERANQFQTDAVSMGLQKAAEETDLEVKQTTDLSSDGYFPGLGNVKEAADFAFSAKPDDISKVISTRSAFVVCGNASVQPETIPSFEDVRDRVLRSYLYIHRIDLAYERTKELAGEVANGKTFEEVAKEADKPILETNYFARHEFVQKVGSDPDFIGAAFALSKQKPVSPGIKARSGAYLMEFVDRQEPDTSFYSAKADSLYQAALTTKRQNFWPQYYNHLRNSAEIIDYRSFYYGG